MESKYTKKDIFLGFKAYTESDADIFKGRSADIERLYDLVSNKDYVLCYAESGEGKSSLIDAGLTPRLRANRYFPVKISFTDEEYNDNSINFDEVIKSRIMEAVSEQQNLSFAPKSDSVFNEKYSEDLWWFLRNSTLSLYGIPFTIVLIFDQFEEVINYPKSEVWTSRFFAFLEKISTDNCPQYILDDINATVDSNDLEFPDIFLKKNFKAIFSIRTEYIGELDYWCMQRYFIPDLKHNRFCLKPLTLQGADEVMQQYEGFDAGLRDNIKDVLLMLKNKDNRTLDAGNNTEQYIPALILSVVCTSLYQSNDKVLTNSLIADSIENFYNDKIRECNITPEERNTIASVLVDKDKRVRVASDCSALDKIKFNSKYKDALLRNRLIKKSNVNGVEYIELVHDSLIDVVKKHKEEAMLKELRKKRRRNISIFSFMSAIILLFVILIVGMKKNEMNYLITQAKFIAAEAEKLAENGNAYDAVRLLMHVGKNNNESSEVADFIHAAGYVDANYMIPKKEFKHKDYVSSASFSPDGRYVVTASGDHTSKLWSVESGDCLMTMEHNIDVNSASFSPDGRYVVTASSDKTSKLWSVESGECLMTMNHEDEVESASFSPDGRYVVTVSDLTSKLWSVESGECLMTMNHYGWVNSASFSPDGRYVVTASYDDTSKLWSVESGECLMTMNHDSWVYSASFSPDGRYVVTASGDDTSKLWSVESGDCLMTMNHEKDVNSASFSPDGRYVVTASDDKTSKLWSVESGECLMTMEHNRDVYSATFSPDGRYVVTASDDKTSKLWSVESGECLMTMNHEDEVESASFSPDGRYVVTASGIEARIHTIKSHEEILDKWSEFLGPNAVLTKEEKEKYFLN
ncbi:MAG: WD40 repeat domain-containing protein [Bacteroidales bacterium]|nr:WD40 repeat domain-containing protein [Bacteroidales bacterium]